MARKPEPTISAVLIVKDEEEYLARCLESVRWVDEIVVYDTGSSDRTVEIARQFTDTVIEGYWNDDFGDARNRALAHATSEWVLIVDADETFEGSPRALRKHLGAGRANFFSVTVATLVPTPGVIEAPVISVRLFRRAEGQYRGALHEQPVNRPGAPMVIRPLPGSAIKHSGYSEGPEAMAARARRNLEIAEREAASTETGTTDAGEFALRQANLARALGGAGRLMEALELADQICRDGSLVDVAMEHLAHSMAVTAAATADFGLAREWADRLRAVLGNPVWADALLVHIAAREGNAELALDALNCIPTKMVDQRGRQVRRVDYASYETWALWKLGRPVDACGAAERAARAGVLAGRPVDLWDRLGPDGVRRVAELLPEDASRLLAVLCTHAGEAGRRVLAIMAEVRPEDLAILLCGSRLKFPHDLTGLEEAATWSARMRAAGVIEECSLIAIATDHEAPAPQRARAAALALYAYDDARALPALEAALAAIEPDDETELAAQLDVLAPGLVQRV